MKKSTEKLTVVHSKKVIANMQRITLQADSADNYFLIASGQQIYPCEQKVNAPLCALIPFVTSATL